jgi:hypothetical protein
MGRVRKKGPVAAAAAEQCPQGGDHSWVFTYNAKARIPQLETGMVKACLKCGETREIKEGEA